MSGSTRSGAGRDAAARSRSAGMLRAGPGRGRSSPGAWRTVNRAELIRAAREGLGFSARTGEAASWATPGPVTTSWLDHAAGYAAMKWPLAAAHTRAGVADALAAITPPLLTPGRGRPPAAILRGALYGHAFNRARAGTRPRAGGHRGTGLGPASLPAAGRAGRSGRDPAGAGRPGPAAGRDPGRGCDYHPQAGCLPRLPRVRGRTRIAGSQPSGPHLMAAPEIVVRRPAVNCYPCRGANGPGRGQQDLPGADRVLRLPIVRGTAPRRSRRPPRHVLHPAGKRLGTADPHRIPAPVRADLDRKRHATRGPAASNTAPAAPAGQSRSPRNSSGSCSSTCTPMGPPPMGGCSGAPEAGRLAKAATAGSGTRPAAPRPCRARRACVPTTCVMPRCRCGWPPAPRPPRSLPAPGTASASCSPSTPTACPAATRSPASTSRKPSTPAAGPPLAHKNRRRPPGILSVMRPCHSWTQRDTAGPGASTQIRLDLFDLRKCGLKSLAHRPRPRAGRSRAPALRTPLTSQDLAHHWPTATGNGLPNRSRTRIRPGIREHRHRV